MFFTMNIQKIKMEGTYFKASHEVNKVELFAFKNGFSLLSECGQSF